MAESQAVAKQALKKLEDQLTCVICLDAFKDPKLLQCFHVYCKDCLTRLVVQDQQGQLSLRCPTCRQSTLLPQAGTVSDLQPAFHIHHLMEIQDALAKVKEPQKVQCGKCTTSRPATGYCRDCGQYICTMCTTVHSEWSEFAEHEVVALEELESRVKTLDALKKVTLYCSLHKGKELELYCETCEELICHNCTVSKHCRPKHEYVLVADMFEKHKAEIVKSLDPIENQLGVVNEALERINQRSVEVNDQQVAVEAEIQKVFRHLHEVLDARKNDLIGQLAQVANQKVKSLAAQKDEVETVQTQLVSCLSFVRECLRTGSQEEVMKVKKTVMKQIKEMKDSFNPDRLEPAEEANVTFMSSDLAESCQQFGEVYVREASPKECYATGKGIDALEVEEKVAAVLHVVNNAGKGCTTPLETVTGEMETIATATKVKCSVKYLEANRYEISYKPTSRGRHHLHIKVEGEHIKGSPFPVTVKMRVTSLGTPVRVINGVKNPWGIAVIQKDEIIVVEYGGNCVSVLNSNGEKLQSFGSYGSGQGQFSRPYGVAVDDEGNILVVDNGNKRIQKITSEGKFVKAVGMEAVDFSNPIGIAIHPDKRILVSENTSSIQHCISVLNPDMTFHSSIGTKEDVSCDSACDAAGNIYIGMRICNSDIQVFTAEGQFLRKFGCKGKGQGELNFPSGIAIDSNNVVYVTENSNHRVSLFTTEGVFLTSFGSRGSGEGQFNTPKGIAVDKDGYVYVSDYGNGRIQIF